MPPTAYSVSLRGLPNRHLELSMTSTKHLVSPSPPLVRSSMSLPSRLYGTIIWVSRGPTYQNCSLQWEIQTCSTSPLSKVLLQMCATDRGTDHK